MRSSLRRPSIRLKRCIRTREMSAIFPNTVKLSAQPDSLQEPSLQLPKDPFRSKRFGLVNSWRHAIGSWASFVMRPMMIGMRAYRRVFLPRAVHGSLQTINSSLPQPSTKPSTGKFPNFRSSINSSHNNLPMKYKIIPVVHSPSWMKSEPQIRISMNGRMR